MKTTSPKSFPDLNNVRLLPAIKRDIAQDLHLYAHDIFTERTFLEHLWYYKTFDIITYSVSPFPLFQSRPIDRLIYSVGQPPSNTKHKLRLEGSHAKLWLCHKGKETHAYVGSANATGMTIFELIVKLTPAQTRAAIKFFNAIWTQNYHKS